MVSLFSQLSIYALEAECWKMSELNTFIDQLWTNGVRKIDKVSSQDTVHATRYTVHCTRYTVHSTPYAVQSIQNIVHSAQ